MPIRVELIEYRFLELQIRWGLGKGEHRQAPPSVHVRDGDSQTGDGGRVVQIEVRVEPEPGAPGLSLFASIAGFFRADGHPDTLAVPPDGASAQIAGILAYNGATILYGILRGEVASLSANFPSGRYLLPTVYMNEVIEAQTRQAQAAAPAPDPPAAPPN